MRYALGIIAEMNVKLAVAFLLENKVELPHVAWSGKDEERSGEAYEWAGIHEDDARYIGPAREELWRAVAQTALEKADAE